MSAAKKIWLFPRDNFGRTYFNLRFGEPILKMVEILPSQYTYSFMLHLSHTSCCLITGADRRSQIHLQVGDQQSSLVVPPSLSLSFKFNHWVAGGS